MGTTKYVGRENLVCSLVSRNLIPVLLTRLATRMQVRLLKMYSSSYEYIRLHSNTVSRLVLLHAACCLLSKSCFYCGKMASTANPLVMKRYCESCFNEASRYMAHCKVQGKESFPPRRKRIAALCLVLRLASLVLEERLKQVSFTLFPRLWKLHTQNTEEPTVLLPSLPPLKSKRVLPST